MKNVLILIAVSLLISCNAQQPITQTTQQPVLKYTVSDSPITLSAENATYSQEIAYGDHENNVFDIFLPEHDAPTALVIYIHGGGFTHGYKEKAYEKYADHIDRLLSQNIAFATIGYRFLQHTDDGVISCLNDSKRCLQFIRHYAQSLNIDPERIACYGESAGAGTSLWLGLSDDMGKEGSASNPYHTQSTRLKAVGAIATQATYNIPRWEEVFADYSIDMDRIPKMMLDKLANFYGVNDFDLLEQEEYIAYRNSLDFLSLLSKDDPPIWVKNEAKDGPPLFTDIQHHPYHAKILKKYADQAGVVNTVYAPDIALGDTENEGLIDFFVRYLK